MPRFSRLLRRAALLGGFWFSSQLLANDAIDAKLGRMAYAALQADEELADLNLGVKALQGGTVILWGPSPSAELTKKAEALLKKIPGVVTVKIECNRDALVDPLVKKVEAEVHGSPPPESKPSVPVPPATPAPQPVVRQVTTVEKPNLETPARPPSSILLEPTPVRSNAATYERLRRSETRFANLRIDEADDRIIITGPATEQAEAWALAKKLTPVVGERRIIVRRAR